MARSHADWLVGMNLSRYFTCLARDECALDEIINIGRVITPTVFMIVDRDNQIANFKAKNFYEIYTQIDVQNGSFKAKWQPDEDLLDSDGYVTDEQTVKDVLKGLEGHSFTVQNIERKKVMQNPPLPFSLARLQIYCNRHYGLSADETLKITQKLYDEKYISYPRTDSEYLPETQLKDAPVVLEQLKLDPRFSGVTAGCNLSLKSRAFNDKKQDGHAHNAIIPSMEPVDVQRLNDTEYKVYDIIRRHYAAQFYVPAEYNTVKVTANCAEEIFISFGRTLVKQGYRVIFTEDSLEDEDKEKFIRGRDEQQEDNVRTNIPDMAVNEIGHARELQYETKKTRPPKHYTQASLLAAMEKVGVALVDNPKIKDNPQMLAFLKEHGIGTSATRAAIIKNILDYNWATEKKGCLYATIKAHQTMNALPKAIKYPDMTAVWEDLLQSIAEANSSKMAQELQIQFEKNICLWLRNVLSRCEDTRIKAAILRQMGRIDPSKEKFTCPKCHSLLRHISGQNHRSFWSCQGCNSIYQDNHGSPVLPLKDGDAPHCPFCNSPMKQIVSKKGRLFWVCTKTKNADCDFIADDKNNNPDISEKCPECGMPLRRVKLKSSNTFKWFCTNKNCNKCFDDLKQRPLTKPVICPECGRAMRLVTHDFKTKKAVTPYFYCSGYNSSQPCHCRTDIYGKRLTDRKKGVKDNGDI